MPKFLQTARRLGRACLPRLRFNTRQARLLIAVVGTMLFACGSGPSTCTELPLSGDAASALARIAPQLDFVPQRPCVSRSGFTVKSVLADNVAGTRRITFAVVWHGEYAFLLSQTRALVPFSAIPQGTHPFSVAADGITATGFAGASGGASDSAYLRWRTGDVTFELAGTLRPWLSENDIREIAEGLMRGAESESPR